jgi:FeS assembly SUF system regulator
MMRLSRLADYAVVVMTHVAQNHSKVHTAAKVASATRLPAPTVAKVLARLCREGLLVSIRGVNGGYTLERPAPAISVGAIVTALDGPVALTQCIKPGQGRCEIETVCPSRVGLHRINMAVRKALDDVSLADIAMSAPIFRGPARPSSSRQLPSAKAHR